jgi:hypothetical protein
MRSSPLSQRRQVVEYMMGAWLKEFEFLDPNVDFLFRRAGW